jgi:hypothetical protein
MINYVVEKGEIERVYIAIYEDNIDIEYKLEEKEGHHRNLYSTKEEATENIPHCLCGY